MSKSGLFAHFGSKQELQLATVEAAALALPRGGDRPGAERRPDGGPRLRAMAAAYLAHLDSDAYSGGCFWAATSAEYDDRPGPGPRRDRRRARRLARRARAPGRDRRRRRARAPRLRALRPGHGRQLALPALRRPARLRLRPRLGRSACWRSCRDERGSRRGARRATSSRRFAEFWSAPSPDRLGDAARRRRQAGRADDSGRPTPSPTAKRAFAAIFELIPDLTAEVHGWGATESGVLIDFTLSGTRRRLADLLARRRPDRDRRGRPRHRARLLLRLAAADPRRRPPPARLAGVRAQPPVASEFSSAAELEAWLEQNHASSEGIWLKIAKKGSGETSVTYAEALTLALCFGWIDSQKQGPRREATSCSASPRAGRGAGGRGSTATRRRS